MSTQQVDDHAEAAEPQQVRCSETEVTVTLKDGRKITTPLWCYRRLLRATPQQPANYELSPFGIHWPEIDEDFSVAGMLRGEGPGRETAGDLLPLRSLACRWSPAARTEPQIRRTGSM
jgi:uncharacterized protein DUF2442